MPKNLLQIQRQIDKLQHEANALRSKEAAGVVERIKVAIQHYGLIAEDFFGGKPIRANGTKALRSPPKQSILAKPSTRPPVAVKYRDGEGNTWTGRGSKPRWLVAHLKSGRKTDDFLVET